MLSKFTFDLSIASETIDNSTEASNSLNDETETTYRRGKFNEVINYISEMVIAQKKAASMKTLYEIYGLNVTDSRYRNKLKHRIKTEFGDQISFLTSKKNLPEIIVSSQYFTSTSVHHDRNESIKYVANILQSDILNKFKDNPQPNWPPTAAELKHSKYDPPTSLTLFLEALLKTSNHSTTRSINTSRLVISFAQDIVYAITKGKIFQLKQYLLAMGLHNLTGSRKVIDLVQKFGHCMNYSPEYTVFTHFWVDNFDVDRRIGGGSIHTTHLVSFQEMSIGCVKSNHQISLQRRKSRKLFLEDININTISIDKKINPPDVFPVCPEEVDETQ